MMNLNEKLRTAKALLIGPLTKFIGHRQRAAVAECLRGEEREWFADKMIELAQTFEKMPKPYSQEKLGENAIVGLHYFYGSGDWWITELGDGINNHSFGLCAPMGLDNAELGYVSIEEIIECGRIELDFHWKPKTLAEIRKNARV